ncbi:AN1-type zinc finger protein 6 isoform X1 [Cimex lectularius]|uniref:AN1-type zinc finger protein 6 n=1 Tax=Cimex lectularius TaxID=79782 RepID=A0A8I6SCI3_CIMLE|nr:AN1-type zinc finger protein 6 isoform X1 [Cimex lectularius]XP_024081162.1 AN1-type zinc finger protein 6 isoform X1 [Cimex lectularius]XP_024081163.1 AN1-type zinc finger protein 6 isoform X1 [Cimex lectularius]XP_024081164.1 AN1-type zinc finger protein 6 isoform X1 [Cimex lectularius]XP_024081165.1 AN1-type zinc finger protein 6 isoform X1 [Cimex lectularius]XP_024081166.1 AN1-type zinc finger protein 6 isoform X1 [Cimex lectularius]XP_024081167.1 AN1-type zinc finger protein 6 isoform
MERESNSMQALCRSGCGFYGNPSTDGLCSLCYKEALKKKQQPPQGAASYQSSGPACAMDTAVPTIPVIAPQPQDIKDVRIINPLASRGMSECLAQRTDDSQCEAGEGAVGGSSIASSDSPDLNKEVDSEGKDDKDKSKKKNRCAVCRKKVGLTGFECRCGGLYCAVHRYSDKHKCTFNYRELGAQEIRRNNPVVVGEKIHKI